MVKFFELVDSYKLAMKDKKEKKLVINGRRSEGPNVTCTWCVSITLGGLEEEQVVATC
jgi:hypothetical protein